MTRSPERCDARVTTGGVDDGDLIPASLRRHEIVTWDLYGCAGGNSPRLAKRCRRREPLHTHSHHTGGEQNHAETQEMGRENDLGDRGRSGPGRRSAGPGRPDIGRPKLPEEHRQSVRKGGDHRLQLVGRLPQAREQDVCGGLGLQRSQSLGLRSQGEVCGHRGLGRDRRRSRLRAGEHCSAELHRRRRRGATHRHLSADRRARSGQLAPGARVEGPQLQHHRGGLLQRDRQEPHEAPQVAPQVRGEVSGEERRFGHDEPDDARAPARSRATHGVRPGRPDAERPTAAAGC